MAIDRREFMSWLGAVVLTGGTVSEAMAAAPSPLALRFPPQGGFPNSRYPALLYRQVLATEGGSEAVAVAFERLFAKHRWPPAWRYGMYPFDHFHSTAHEALGIASGHARVRLGGPKGGEYEVRAGDALVLPAGTGHCNLGSSPDFLMVGAYPQGQQWDLRRGDMRELAEATANIAKVPLPVDDPVGGTLVAVWK